MTITTLLLIIFWPLTLWLGCRALYVMYMALVSKRSSDNGMQALSRFAKHLGARLVWRRHLFWFLLSLACLSILEGWLVWG